MWERRTVNSPYVRCACVVGTRPEAIKLAPLIRGLRRSGWAEVFVIASGQQADLLLETLDGFQIRPDFVIPHDRKDESIAPMLGALVCRLDEAFARLRPAVVVGQGDTTSAFAAALAAFYRGIAFVHVEAGLRSGDLSAPFPEEFHRRVIAVSSTLHCAPTEASAEHLRAENIPDDRILICGNTVIDALLERAASKPQPPPGFPALPRTILVTAHRRESFGEPLREALTAIRTFVNLTPDTAVFFPVHPNPAARAAAYEILAGHERIVLCEPVGYDDFVGALRRTWLVITDSGGVQEEAPALGKPVLILRSVTERPEAITAGASRLVGTGRSQVFEALMDLYCDPMTYARMARPVLPYGDGRAAQRIVAAMRKRFAPPASSAAMYG